MWIFFSDCSASAFLHYILSCSFLLPLFLLSVFCFVLSHFQRKIRTECNQSQNKLRMSVALIHAGVICCTHSSSQVCEVFLLNTPVNHITNTCWAMSVSIDTYSESQNIAKIKKTTERKTQQPPTWSHILITNEMKKINKFTTFVQIKYWQTFSNFVARLVVKSATN